MAKKLTNNTVIMSVEEYAKLRLSSFRYTQLLANDVQSWEGFEDSMSEIGHDL